MKLQRMNPYARKWCCANSINNLQEHSHNEYEVENVTIFSVHLTYSTSYSTFFFTFTQKFVFRLIALHDLKFSSFGSSKLPWKQNSKKLFNRKSPSKYHEYLIKLCEVSLPGFTSSKTWQLEWKFVIWESEIQRKRHFCLGSEKKERFKDVFDRNLTCTHYIKTQHHYKLRSFNKGLNEWTLYSLTCHILFLKPRSVIFLTFFLTSSQVLAFRLREKNCYLKLIIINFNSQHNHPPPPPSTLLTLNV